jgi:hypothetical protein
LNYSSNIIRVIKEDEMGKTSRHANDNKCVLNCSRETLKDEIRWEINNSIGRKGSGWESAEWINLA